MPSQRAQKGGDAHQTIDLGASPASGDPDFPGASCEQLVNTAVKLNFRIDRQAVSRHRVCISSWRNLRRRTRARNWICRMAVGLLHSFVATASWGSS